VSPPDHISRDQLIARVIGPSEAELTCDECFDALDRYVELELDGADADRVVAGMRPHLEGCPACQHDYGSLLAYLKSRPKSG